MLLNFVLFLPAALAFNLDLRFPHIYHHSAGDPADYFGFNVALHPGNSSVPGDQSWMMVGAPKRNNAQFPQPRTRNSGVVTICPFNETCTKLNISRGGYLKQNLTGEMFGSVLDVRDGLVLTCAPNWKILDDSANNEKYKLLGTCYQTKADNLNSFVNVTPLANDLSNLATKHGETVQPYFLYGEAGFSAHYSQNFQDKRKELVKNLVLGAPGIFNWKGSTVLYEMQDPRKPANDIPEPIVHNPQRSIHIAPFGLFGYAVTSGRFFLRGKIYQVAGAPRSKHNGQVIIYEFPSKSHASITHHQTLNGAHFGSYFGAAVAACDINGDGFDDLFVGAPMYTSQLGEDYRDEGAVYVYMAGKSKFKSLGDITLTNPSKAQNGRFGTTISCIGDLDQDGFQDVAISAPFERHADPYETSGVVYIYSGSSGGLLTSPIQVIRASEVFQQRFSRKDFPPLQGFGFSISRGQDLDENGYPDLAIGAYFSGHAVILRSQPVVSLSVYIHYDDEGSSSSIPRDAKEVHIRICPKYTGVRLPASLQVTQTLEVDSDYNRLKTGNPTSRVEVRHENNEPICQRVKLTFHENVQDFLKPIPIKVSYKLPNDSFRSTPVLFTEQEKLQAKDFFCSSCPITNIKSKLSLEHSMTLHFATDCGSNNICLANLALDVNFIATNNTKSYVIGSPNPPMLHVSVTNAADSNPAYNARVRITLPTGATYLPQGCNKESKDEEDETSAATTIICEIGNPLQPGKSRSLQLGLDMSSVSGAQGSLVASVKTFTLSTNLGTVGPVNDTLDLAAIADIAVSGKSAKEQYYFDTKEEEDETKWEIIFDLNYQIEKFGISPVDKVLFSLQVPTFTKKSKQFLEIISSEIYVDETRIQQCLDDAPREETSREKRQAPVSQAQQHKFPANRTMVVSCGRDDWNCEQISCMLGPFRSSLDTARIQFKLRLNTKVLESMLGRRDIIVFETDAHVEITQPSYIRQPDNDLSDSAVVSATLIGRVPEGHVEPWVLALSVIGGVLILLVLITGLIKAGFFERKEKKALVELKRKTQMDLEEYQRVSAMQNMENMDDDDDE